MEETQIRLQEASRLFNNKNYAECESTLRSIANKDLKIQHNIAIAHYLSKGGDVREVLAELGKGGDDSSTASGAISLAYEGHEIAHYNRAVLLAYQGRCEEAAAVLREMLQLHECIAPMVLGRCVCLFQMVTNATPIAAQTNRSATGPAAGKAKTSVTQPRSKSDDELVGKVLQLYMNDFKKDAPLFRMLQGALAADGSALHELFKSGASPVEKAVYFNDLGVLTMAEGKHQTAALYFAKATRLLDEASADTFTKHSVLFNFAICSLHRQDFAAALNALTAVQDTMQTSASYWMRVSQAALGHFHTMRVTSPHQDASTTYDTVQQERAAQLSKGSIQAGYALLQLPDAACVTPFSLNGVDCDQRHATLMLARRAAQYGVQILGGANTLALAADQFYSEGRVQDYRTIQYAYLYVAAAALLLQDYAVTIKYASELIAVHRSRAILPDVQSSALLHVVEAYCRVNKPSAALKTLSAASLGELLVASERTDGQQKVRTEALFVNLVLVHLGCGNYKQAQSIMATLVPKLTSGPASSTTSGRTAALLQVYIDLALGNKEKVVEQLSKCSSGVAGLIA